MPEMPAFARLSHLPLRECDAVAAAAIEHLGKKYLITRELRPGFIDCSTVVSQSYWTGAAIQIPFIAESQRLAANGRTVEYDEMIPGDAVYAYPTKAASPQGRHNHVVLYLGCDDDATGWFMESREDSGAVLVRKESVAFGGGIRRFCLNPSREFPVGLWSELVRRVPKLGRLGSRLTADYTGRVRHHGVDIYVDGRWLAVSPFNGSIVDVERTHRCVYVGIWSELSRAYSVVGPVDPVPEICIGKDVSEGDILGRVAQGRQPGRCNMVPGTAGGRHVHWELWASRDFGSSPLPNPNGTLLPKAVQARDRLIPHNPLYSLKCADIGSCVKPIAG